MARRVACQALRVAHARCSLLSAGPGLRAGGARLRRVLAADPPQVALDRQMWCHHGSAYDCVQTNGTRRLRRRRTHSSFSTARGTARDMTHNALQNIRDARRPTHVYMQVSIDISMLVSFLRSLPSGDPMPISMRYGAQLHAVGCLYTISIPISTLVSMLLASLHACPHACLDDDGLATPDDNDEHGDAHGRFGGNT